MFDSVIQLAMFEYLLCAKKCERHWGCKAYNALTRSLIFQQKYAGFSNYLKEETKREICSSNEINLLQFKPKWELRVEDKPKDSK